MQCCALASLLVLAACGTSLAQDGMVERGQSLAIGLCGPCHATGKVDRSPQATAPAFRRLEPRVDLNELEQRLREGLLAGHPEMPAFILKREEAHALVTYLRSIRD